MSHGKSDHLMTSLKKDGSNFSGFFSSSITGGGGGLNGGSIEMPPPIRFGYMEVREFIDEFEGKVAYAKQTNQGKLKNKVLVDLNRLNREERMVQKLEEKLAKQGIDVNESSLINKDLKDLQSLEQFSNNMKATSDMIQRQIDQCAHHIVEMKADIAARKKQIKITNSSVMRTTAGKEALSHYVRTLKRQAREKSLQQQSHQQSTDGQAQEFLTQPPQSLERKQPPLHPRNNLSSTQTEMKFKKINSSLPSVLRNTRSQQLNDRPQRSTLQRVVQETKRVQGINDEIKQYFLKKSNGFAEMKKALHECFASQSKRVVKSHAISNKQGLANSIIFEFNTHSGGEEDSMVLQNSIAAHANHPLPRSSLNLLQHTNLQDRQLRNILYDTIKHIKAVKISQEEQQASIERLAASRIPYAEFKEFSSDQILSLLMVRPALFHQLFAVFEIKEKALNFMILKAKMLFKQQSKLYEYQQPPQPQHSSLFFSQQLAEDSEER